VSVLVELDAEQVRSVVGHWATTEEVTATTCRVRMSAEDLGWPVMLLGVIGADFTVESPPELRDRARVVGELLLRSATRT
jgi:predicted DNA-binding transcriptional regulator YafY